MLVAGELREPRDVPVAGPTLAGEGSETAVFYLAIPPSAFELIIPVAGRGRPQPAGPGRGGEALRPRPGERPGAQRRPPRGVPARSASSASTTTSGKESVEDLLVFRFSNSLLEPIWNRRYVASVQITMAETHRRRGAGRVLRLRRRPPRRRAEPPAPGRDPAGHGAARRASTPTTCHDEKAKVLAATGPSTRPSIVRGQYRGYLDEPGVAPDSTTETFVAAPARDRLVALGRRALVHPGRQGAGRVRHRGGRRAEAAAAAAVRRAPTARRRSAT